EPLESRRLLTVSGQFAFIDDQNVLHVTGDADDNVFRVEQRVHIAPGDKAQIVVEGDGHTITLLRPPGKVLQVEIDLGAGDDFLENASGLSAKIMCGDGDDTV